MPQNNPEKTNAAPLPAPDSARFVAALENFSSAIRGLATFHLNACVRCGLCGETCHIYQTEPVPENLPGAKAGKVMNIYRRYNTFLGRLVPTYFGAKDLTPETLAEIVDAVYGRCTACGRCSLHCSVGLDVAAIIRAGRNLAAAAGAVPEGIAKTVKNQLETGNQMAIPKEEFLSTAEWLSEDLQTEMKDPAAKIHVDEPGKKILYLVNPREVKFFPLSLMAAAGVFHAAGESWTLSSKFFDVTNYGLFAGDDESAAELVHRALEAAEELGAEEIVLSECGHGFRAFRWEGPNWIGAVYRIPTRSILELLDEYIASGRIKPDKEKVSERVTLHDPCNLVRWGGVSEPQRRILRACVKDFVEMTPNRADNFCCGGGGGMLSTSEYAERRVLSGKIKSEQIRATGAKIVATPCHNCADQLIELSKKYNLRVEIKSLVEIVYDALPKPSGG